MKGLQIQSSLQQSLIDQLSFKVSLNQRLAKRMSDGSTLILSDHSISTYAIDLAKPTYWHANEVLTQPAHINEKWKTDYAQSAARPILAAVQGVLSRFELIETNGYFIIARPAYSAGILLGFGLLMALLGIAAPSFVDFIRNQSRAVTGAQ